MGAGMARGHLLLFVCLILQGFKACSCLDADFWTRDLAFDDQAVATDQVSLSTHQRVTSQSTTDCGATCRQQAWCQSFFFQAATQDCRLHADSFAMPVGATREPGLRYYKSREDSCHTWRGYRREASSGVCYRVLETPRSRTGARSDCQAEGAALVTLDTPVKIVGVFDALIDSGLYEGKFFHVGASRPPSEWFTPWTNSSSFFVWEKTGESLMPFLDFGSFTRDNTTNENCIFYFAVAWLRVNDTFAQPFSDGWCSYPSPVICEM